MLLHVYKRKNALMTPALSKQQCIPFPSMKSRLWGPGLGALVHLHATCPGVRKLANSRSVPSTHLPPWKAAKRQEVGSEVRVSSARGIDTAGIQKPD